MELPIGRGHALDPALVHIGVDHTDIKRSVAYGHPRADHVRQAEDVMPIRQIVDGDPLTRMHQGRAAWGTGESREPKGLVVQDPPMGALTPIGQAHGPGLAWAVPKGRMLALIVDVIDPRA